MKTREQIENLKLNWKKDPTWDIESTEGCEDYKDELRIFSENCIANWTKEAEKHHAKLASKFCPLFCDNCKVEQCAWWNEDEEKCVVRVLSMRG